MKAESGLLGPFIKQRIACTRELLERLVLKYIPGSEEGSHLVGGAKMEARVDQSGVLLHERLRRFLVRGRQVRHRQDALGRAQRVKFLEKVPYLVI